MEANPAEKHKSGILSLFLMVYNNVLCMQQLPLSVLYKDQSNPASLLPIHRRIIQSFRLVRQVNRLRKKHKHITPLRFTDPPEGVGEREIPVGLAGRLETDNASAKL